jgi:hypothetical protein
VRLGLSGQVEHISFLLKEHAMKALLLVLTLIAFPAFAFGQAVVYPTGDPVQDVSSVRDAVRGGGTVLLRATDARGQPRAFDFGDFPVSAINWNDSGSGWVALGISGEIVPVTIGSFIVYVSIGNDVRLLGETTEGGVKTTVRGGTIPIRNFAQQIIPGVGERYVFGLATLTVEGIRFEESALQSIYTTQLGSFSEIRALVDQRGLDLSINIRGNEFIDVQPALDRFWYALAAVTDGPAGSVRVEENRARFTSGRWDEDERAYELAYGLPRGPEIWEGFSIADLNSPGSLARNNLHGVDVGLLVYFEGNDVVRIVDNQVELRPEGFFGIACQANHTYLVEGNTVIASGANPDGIVLYGTDLAMGINRSTVRHNRVVLDGSDFGGISLFGGGTSNYLAQNQVEGSGAYALGLVSDFFAPDGVATENSFAGNQISLFSPRDSAVYGTGAGVFFDTHSQANILVGHSGTVKDLGQGNFVTGTVQGGPSPGHALSDALAAKRELLRYLRP